MSVSAGQSDPHCCQGACSKGYVSALQECQLARRGNLSEAFCRPLVHCNHLRRANASNSLLQDTSWQVLSLIHNSNLPQRIETSRGDWSSGSDTKFAVPTKKTELVLSVSHALSIRIGNVVESVFWLPIGKVELGQIHRKHVPKVSRSLA